MAYDTLEQTGRTVGTSHTGIEIIRKFYVEPYDAHAEVIKSLRGYIKDGKRVAPCHDPYITNCFCTDARVEDIDPDAWCSANSIDEGKLEAVLQKKKSPKAGATIVATYRPMITAWKNDDDDERFDWLDPLVQPGIRQVPWPQGLFAAVDSALFGDDITAVPKEVASPLGVTVSDITIRRILVPEIKWEVLQQCANCVNIVNFPGPGYRGLPDCQPRTLRFDGANVENMIDTEGQRWYQLNYHFKWIDHWSNRLHDGKGKKTSGWVTWNHVFMRPWWFHGAGTGWYEVYQGEDKEVRGVTIPNFPKFGLQLTGGRLYNEANFADLFKVDPK